MRIDKKQFQKWIKALRGGEFKQTTNVLQDEKGYCCLGVACEILMPTEKKQLVPINFGQKLVLSGEMPYEQPKAPIWLKDINSDFEMKTGVSLSTLNDDEGFSFEEIADVLELVYIHKAKI